MSMEYGCAGNPNPTAHIPVHIPRIIIEASTHQFERTELALIAVRIIKLSKIFKHTQGEDDEQRI